MRVFDDIRQIHFLKTVQPYFDLIGGKKKKFEVRFNDRDYSEKDVLILAEFHPISGKYSGLYWLVYVDYILDDRDFCKRGFIIMSVTLFDEKQLDNSSMEMLTEKLKLFNRILKQQLCSTVEN